jgi:hypothetical protein
VGGKSFARRRRKVRFCKFKYLCPQANMSVLLTVLDSSFSSLRVKNVSLLSLELHLQGSLKLVVFFRSKFFAKKRSVTGNMKFMDISFEKIVIITIPVWVGQQIKFFLRR